MSSSFLALPPPCKPCSPPPTSSKNKKSSSRSSSRESSTRTISPKAKSLSHIGIFLPKTHNHRRRRAPSHYYHDYSSSFSSSYHHSESSSLSNDDEYHDAAISLAAHLLMRGHDVTIITASSSTYDRRPHGNNNNHEKKKKKTRQKNDLQRNATMHRIGDMIKDHLPFCEGGGGGGDDDENLALVIDRLLIGVYDSPPSLDEEGDDDDEEDKIMLFLSSSSSDLPLDLSFSSVPPPSLSSSSSDKGGSLLRDPDLITMIEEQAKQPLHALVMDYTNVEVMLLAEHYRIPSLLLHHHHHHHLGNHQHLHGEMMIRNSKQLKSFILLSQADSNRRASSSSPASSTSSFLASSWWQSFMERVHTSWLDLQFGLVPFIRYNHLRQRCGLTILRRLLPDAWQASGAIMVHLQQSTGPRITGDTTSTAMRAALPPKELPLLPVDNNRYDDDDIPNFISVQGPVIPPCFPCNENATDDTSPHPPCLIAASSSTATPLTSSTTKSVWSSWSTSSSSTTATTTSKKKKEKKKNIILWDDSLPYYYDSSSSSSPMARTMTESEHVVLNQLSHERKLLHALTLARDSLASWNHNRDDASNTLMNTTTTTTAEYNKTLSSLSDDFDIIRLEESERHQDSRNGGDLGVNSINNDIMSLLVGADQENRDLQPEFLKIHHVTTTFLDAISYYSHYSAKHHFQLILVMTNRCHDGHHHHHHGASQSQQQQDDIHDEKTDRRHHQHWLESMDFPVLCVHDDAQETVRQLALRILRKLHQRDQVVQETAPTANTTTTNTASGKETATTQNNSTSTNSNKERQSPVWELVTLIEALAHVQKRPRIVWNTGRQLGAELLERVVVPWNNRKTSQYNNASTSWQPMSPLSPGATLGQPSHQPPPPLEVSMAWVILVLSIMYLFLRKVWLVRMSHRSGRSSQRLQQDDEQQRHDAHNVANRITNGTNIDSNTIDGLFSLLVQGTSRRLSHLDLALQLLQDWVNTELEKYHRSHTVASDAGAITANGDSTSEESGGGGVSGPRSRRKNAKKKNA
jgi:hypothetical protein